MLDRYKAYQKDKFQYIIVDATGLVLESDHSIFTIAPNSLLQQVHPFFEILSTVFVLETPHEFSCINLEFNGVPLTVDLHIDAPVEGKTLIIIENLTRHYTNYQLTAQRRNESIINAQILELKNDYLLEKESFKNNFIANFSHELRNPITAAIIFGDLLETSALDASQKGYLDIIQAAHKDLKHKIDDILDLAKIESGQLILNTTVFNFKSLCSEVAKTYSILAREKGLDFEFLFDTKLPEFLEGDPLRCKQIMTSLLDNAITFTTTGTVTLSLALNYNRAQKANIQITVQDTGCGIAPQHHDTIFERFLKIESGVINQDSSGLGLAIVNYLVTAMEGSIKLESTPNEGATFRCNINFKISNYSPQQKEELLDKQPSRNNEKHHVLLVEDSEIIQLSVLKLLAATGQFFVSIASKGEDVIPNIIDQNVDLILLSNTIPDFSIMDIALFIRSLSPEYKKIPIIALSTEAYKADIKRFKKAGVAEVLTKPFDETTLLDRIYKILA